jgi:hypothetical protein
MWRESVDDFVAAALADADQPTRVLFSMRNTTRVVYA